MKKKLAITLATVVLCSVGFTACEKVDFEKGSTPDPLVNTGAVVEPSGAIELMSTTIEPSEYETYGVSENVIDARLVKASYPDDLYVSNTAVDWTATYMDDPRPEGIKLCFPASENINDHITITPISDDGLTVIVACISPFPVRICITVRSKQSPNLSDSLVCEYGGAVEGIHNNIVIDEAVAATCWKSGLTEGKHCEDCGLTLEGQQETEALSHQELILTKDGGNAFTNICRNCFGFLPLYATNYFDRFEAFGVKLEFSNCDSDKQMPNSIYRVYSDDYSIPPRVRLSAVITTAKGETFETDEHYSSRIVEEDGWMYYEVGFTATEFQNAYSSDDVFYVKAAYLFRSDDGYYYFSFVNEAADVGTADPFVGAKISVVGFSENQFLDIEVLTGLIDE
jgi:hypothetical protein